MNKQKNACSALSLFFLVLTTTNVASACTIFTTVSEDTVFFGNNEDYTNPNTYIWFTPDWGKYGGAYVGYNLDPNTRSFSIQGGMNEKGLAFDANALPMKRLYPNSSLPYSERPYLQIMQECATVTEAIDLAMGYNWGTFEIGYQIHLADATGDAVVISAGTDGMLNFTRKVAGNGFLVSTNFNLGDPKNGNYPCQRYETAMAMLEEIDHEEELTVDQCRDILDATHFEGVECNTLYSNIFDLRNRMIYLYYFHQFEEVVQLNLMEELAKGEHYFHISELFSQETLDRAAAEYDTYQSGEDIPGFLYDSIILGLVGSIVINLLRNRKNKQHKHGDVN